MQEVFRLCVNSFFTLVENHTRASTFHMPHMTLQGIVYRHTGAGTRLAVISSQARGLLKGAARDITASSFDDYMRTRHATRMQPGVISGCLVKCHFFVLATVLANQDRKSIAALHMQWNTTTEWYWLPFLLLTSLAFV